MDGERMWAGAVGGVRDVDRGGIGTHAKCGSAHK